LQPLTFSDRFLRPATGRHVTLTTRLIPEQCVERLTAHFGAVSRDETVSPTDFPVKGRVGDGTFAFRRFVWVRNNEQPEVRGTIRPGGTGSTIDAYVGVAFPVRMFWPLTTLLLLAVLGAAAAAFLGRVPAISPVVPFWFLLVYAIFRAIGIGMSLGDEELLVSFLRETLEATETAASEAIDRARG
jgi:hypothetical protein